jgi:hypothetical protein
MQHKIPLNSGSKPFKHKTRQFNPLLLPIIEKELKILLNAKIIVPLRYSEWVANLVPVRKKNGEIRLCVDFRNLNRCSLKDNYPLPKMDHILQRVVGAQRISMLDGYSGYNHISVMEEDKRKIAFTTPWGTFMYEKMPFGLMNAGATFQRAMDITFIGEKDKFMVIYLDDITVFSKSDDEHLQHLKQTFEKCRRYGISLNPKKSHFAMEEGKILGHIVSKEGIKIDPERVKAIQRIEIPRNKKFIQYFIGKIIFLRRFIPNFAEIIKLITDMLKKNAEIKWIPEAKESFENIKHALIEVSVLISLDYSKEFLIFSFASEDTIVVVLLQRNDQGYEQPISFFSKTLRDSELKYDIMEKQAYALVKSLKSFRVYVLHSEITAYVPNSAVKEILVQPDCEGKRGKWITKILEYNLTINPTKLIKGQGLAKLMTESNCRAIGLHHFSNKSMNSTFQVEETGSQVSNRYSSSPWYKDIIYFLLNLQSPPDLDKSKFRSLKLKSVKYCIINQTLFWKDPNGILLRCVDEEEAKQIFFDLHQGVCGGHHHWNATAFKILRAGYYWNVLFSDIFSQVRACEPCQKFARKHKLMSLPLKPIIAHGPFQ